MDETRKSSLTDNSQKDVLKSGKKLNDEISKIQKKIEEFEAQKKKMNIEFTPFSTKNRSVSNLAPAAARLQHPTPDTTGQHPTPGTTGQHPTPDTTEPHHKLELKTFSQMGGPSTFREAKVGYSRTG